MSSYVEAVESLADVMSEHGDVHTLNLLDSDNEYPVIVFMTNLPGSPVKAIEALLKLVSPREDAIIEATKGATEPGDTVTKRFES